MFEELGVPQTWLHECQALHAKTSCDHHQLAFHLLKSSHWQSGHDALMRHVAAGILFDFDYEIAKSYFTLELVT